MNMMPKCRAKSKQTGKQCGNFAVKNKAVCRFHGGESTGAKTPEGKLRQKMASWKHGLRSKEAMEGARCLRQQIKFCRQFLNEHE